MTENEAIEYLNNHYLAVGHLLNPPKEECEKHNAVMDIAIKALSEIQQYRAIGTIEEFKALKEKSVAKKIKPIHVRYNTKGTGRQHHSIYCGNCGAYSTRVYLGDKHCRRYGSAIDWQ